MNEKVYVTVKGLHFNPEHPDMEEDVIEAINAGTQVDYINMNIHCD